MKAYQTIWVVSLLLSSLYVMYVFLPSFFNKSNYFFNKITILFTISLFCVIIYTINKIDLSENLKNRIDTSLPASK